MSGIPASRRTRRVLRQPPMLNSLPPSDLGVGLTTPAPHSVGSSDQCQGRRLTNRVLGRINLLEFLKRPEGKQLEFKPDLPSPDGALKSIVAYTNTAGDILVDRGG